MAGRKFIETGAAEYSMEVRYREIKNSIAMKPDILITPMNEGPALGPLLLESMEKGITTIAAEAVDVAWSLDHGVPFYTSDAFKDGEQLGRLVCDLIVNRLGKKKGIIAIGDINPGGHPIIDRIQGQQAAIKKYNQTKGTNFTTDVYPDAGMEGAQMKYERTAAEYEKTKDNLVALTCTGQGKGQVLWSRDAGFLGEKRPFIAASFDFSPILFEGLEDGSMDILTSAKFYNFGLMPAAQAWAWIERDYRPDNVFSVGDVATPETLPAIKAKVKIWETAAKEYGFIK
jgi:ABC-type sugar transport system substrate-binding protein